MFFTQEDYRKIGEYLKLNSYKDTDLPLLEREDIDIDNDIMTIVHNGKNYKISLQKLIAAYEWEKLDSVDSIEIVKGGIRRKDNNDATSDIEYFYSVNFDQLKEIVDSNKLVYLNFEDLIDHLPNIFILLSNFWGDTLVGISMLAMYLGGHRINVYGLTRGQNGEIVTQVHHIDFQEKLISGTNIKTVNSESLLGEGDINTKPAYLNVTSTTVNGQTSYTWDNSYFGLKRLIDKGKEVIVVLNGVDVDGRLEKMYLYYDTETSPLEKFGEEAKYTFTGTVHFGTTPIAVMSITAGRGIANDIATDVRVASFALASEISLSYTSPLDEGGIAPGDTYEEAFHKLEEQINSMKDHSGGDDTPEPAALIYYGTSSTALSTGAQIQGLHSSTSTTVEDIYNGAYYYIAVHSSKQLKSIINRGVEPVTANFILKNSSLTIASNTYKLYECSINVGAETWDMDTYELTITIE